MSEREQFEAWVVELDCPAVSIKGLRESDGTYYNFEAQLAWEAWQARADLATERERELVEALRALVGSEWMVSPSWTTQANRDAVLDKAQKALAAHSSDSAERSEVAKERDYSGWNRVEILNACFEEQSDE